MQVKKNGLMDSQMGIQKNNHEQDVGHDKIPIYRRFHGKIENAITRESIGIDRVRNQVLNLHGEVKDIQTKISRNQMQIAFLENLPINGNQGNGWREKLESFMKDQFSESIVIKPEPDLKTYILKLGNENKSLGNDMLTREIKLENIISSGIMDSEKSEVSDIIVRDIEKAREVFSKMKTDSVSRVLKF
ncbi:MAG: hypothetical protein OEV66_07600 [Spirochaetia bacterium]|nr:hypothetical protein [Spirochaetia bacterium]